MISQIEGRAALTSFQPGSTLCIPDCARQESVCVFDKVVQCLLRWHDGFVAFCLRLVKELDDVFCDVLDARECGAVG